MFAHWPCAGLKSWAMIYRNNKNSLNLLKYYILVIFLMGACSSKNIIGRKEHNFNEVPKNILWFQVAGLTTQQLALLRYNEENGSIQTAFERMNCFGHLWQFNFYKLRPSAKESFDAQILGIKNIQNSCQDYKNKTFWQRFKEGSRRVGIFEVFPESNESIVNNLTCRDENNLKEVVVWKMSDEKKRKGRKYFNYKGKIPSSSGVHYDKSCGEGDLNCFSTMQENLREVRKQFLKEGKNNILIVRDFKFKKLLLRKNIHQAQEYLRELQTAIVEYLQYANEKRDTLVLISGGSPRAIEFPSRGKQWEDYLKGKNNFLFKKQGLMSPVFAYGSGAEGFCGIYEESEMVYRIFQNTERPKELLDLLQ